MRSASRRPRRSGRRRGSRRRARAVTPSAGQRAAGGLEVARLGERDRASRPRSGRRSGRPGSPRRAARREQRGRARAAAEHDRAQPRAGARAGVEQRPSWVGTSEATVMSPSCSVGRRSASNGSSTTVVAAIAERSRTISPPTWESGSGHSQRSSGSRPSATAEPRALALRCCRSVSSTGRGAPVVPRGVDDQRDLVVARLADVERRAAVRGAAARRRGARRRAAAPALALAQPRVDRHGGRARAAGRRAARPRSPGPAGSAIATRSPGAAPRLRAARPARRAQQLARRSARSSGASSAIRVGARAPRRAAARDRSRHAH